MREQNLLGAKPVVSVTGASGGIGRDAVIRHFHNNGLGVGTPARTPFSECCPWAAGVARLIKVDPSEPAREFGDSDVRVNSLASEEIAPSTPSPGADRGLARAGPMKRPGRPDEVAETVLSPPAAGPTPLPAPKSVSMAVRISEVSARRKSSA